MKNFKTEEYVNQERRAYSLYTLESRAIPALTDGFKAGARRVVWMARDGKKYKSANLAGMTLPIHPHDLPDGSINTLAGKYINNVCVLHGDGAFGTRLAPTGAFGASRYTSVKASDFCKDAVYTDIDLVPLIDNYDLTVKEPAHFLPLVPMVYVNAIEGIATGFACDILPRKLDEIIADQIAILKGKKIKDRAPTITCLSKEQVAREVEGKWVFTGTFEQVNKTTIKVTELPYGLEHSSFLTKLDKLVEKGVIKDYEDSSSDTINITVKVPYGFENPLQSLDLERSMRENPTMINFDHKTVITPTYTDAVKSFTEWRLSWYYKRFAKEIDQLRFEMQRGLDILTAYNNGINEKSKTLKSRADMIVWLEKLKVVHVEYVAGLPIYRFAKEEIAETKSEVAVLKSEIKRLEDLMNSPDEVRKVYISELQQVAVNFGKGKYDTKE